MQQYQYGDEKGVVPDYVPGNHDAQDPTYPTAAGYPTGQAAMSGKLRTAQELLPTVMSVNAVG